MDPHAQHGERALPGELEREIFEVAALSRPVVIPDLMLVAHRVKIWVESLLYRTIFISRLKPIDCLPHFTADLLLRLIKEKPDQFFARSVHRLYLGHAFDELRVIVAACTGVTDLFIDFKVLNPGIHLLNVLNKMTSLRRLTLEIDRLYDGSPVNFSDPLFRNITHLEILDPVFNQNVAVWASITSIPNLTHLAFSDPNFCPVLGLALNNSDQLECLVFLSPSEHQLATPLTADIRFVISGPVEKFEVDWQLGGDGRDYWARADTVIAARRDTK
ncbi:hypothetical protein DFH06DRAFT_1328172 [Mycena polygramma]|nr:hypothetical protein DFH06DRAFT_1328172 [Mycena polygramma]